MDVHYPTISEPATPDYVLAVLRDMHRQQCQYDPEADPTLSLSLDTTIAEWRKACDLVNWRALGHAQNRFWNIYCSDAEWRAVLEPANQKRLADVCGLIASRALRPRIRQASLFGCSCAAAGAFRTIRWLLAQAGACEDQITPSTPLARYARRYCERFLGPISRLAPGSLPLVRIRTPIYHIATKGILAGILCLLIGRWIGMPVLTIGGVFLFALSYALTWFAARCLLPASVEFGELRTFRDLALTVASGRIA